MTDSRYAIFHFDLKTMTMRDAADPLIFDSLADAETYSQQKWLLLRLGVPHL